MFVKNLSSFKLGDKFDKFNYFDTCCVVESLNTDTSYSSKPVTELHHLIQNYEYLAIRYDGDNYMAKKLLAPT